jgi:transposase
MPNKTDRNDARGIAQIMRTGWDRVVHVKSPSCRSWRALLTARRMLINKRRDIENGIRALLREVGLKVGTPSRKAFPARVRELAAGDAALASLAGSMLSVIEVMSREVEQLTRRGLEEVHGEPTCRRWMTVPVRRDRRSGAHQPARRRAGANRALRGSPFVADPQYQMVGAAGVGDERRQAPRHGARTRRGRPQAGGDTARHVGRRQRGPLGQAGHGAGGSRVTRGGPGPT